MVKAYFQNGITIEGVFRDSMPTGNCIVTFTEQNVESEVEFKNGKRSGFATYDYKNNGLFVVCNVADRYSTLCKSIVPYTRNYYNHSALCIGDNSFKIESIKWKGEELDMGKNPGLKWLLENFDVAQRHIRFNMTGNLRRRLPEDYQLWAGNKEFSRLEHVTLCAQKIIKRDVVNYLLPAVQKLSSLNTFLLRSADLLSQPAIDTDVKLFTENASIIFPILQCSPFLRLLQFIAVPRSLLIFGDPKEEEEMNRFCLHLSELKHLTDLIFESKHYYSFGLE